MTLATVTSLEWGHSALALVVDISPDGPVGVRTLAHGDPKHPARATQPLVEVLTAGNGRARVSHRNSETAIGRRLVYTGSEQTRDGDWHELRIDLRDEQSELAAQVCFRSVEGVGACQVTTRITNQGQEPALLLGVTSFAAGLLGCPVDDADLMRADSEWLGEGRWTTQPLRDRRRRPEFAPARSGRPRPVRGRSARAPGPPARSCPRPASSTATVDRPGCGRSSTTARGDGRWVSAATGPTLPCSARPTSTTSGSTASNPASRSRPCRCPSRSPTTAWRARRPR